MQWPTGNFTQLTGHALSAFETMLKEESLLKTFNECKIESNSALVVVKEFIINKLKHTHFTKHLLNCCSEYCKKEATRIINLMSVTCSKIGSNNFTKLTNRLDEMKKHTPK